jgi:predicted nuclease of predicted toxin-antitoxin system
MAIALYMDAHVPRAITIGLRIRTVDVLTAQEDSADTLPDDELLDRATQLKRVLFTFDDDLLAEAAKRQQENQPFCGVIYPHPLRISIGQCVQDLELIAKAGEPEDLQNRVEFLPP